MAYEVIARKWRPQTFDEVVGQEAITRTLRNAVEQERLHHAYLFTGARGVGKTTTARILAKSLNCAKGVTAEPCGVCPSCVEIAAGGSLDVIEIDAASHTGVDNIRDVVINSVGIAPARDRYKIFIVDEVHQLSAAAFNALLKTLEEPPSRVVFVLATTELHKVPDTITSRCQLFEFRTIPLAKVQAKLGEIAANMGVEITPAALAAVARAGEGSMRDAQSALDQVIAFAGDRVDMPDVATALGVVGDETLYDALDSISRSDAPALLRAATEIVASGHDLRNFVRAMMRAVRNLLVVRAAGYDPELVDASEADAARLSELAGRFAEAELVRAFSLLAQLEQDIRHSADPRFQLEIGLVRLAELPRLRPLDEILDRLSRLEARLMEGGGAPPATGRARPAAPERPAPPAAERPLRGASPSFEPPPEPPPFFYDAPPFDPTPAAAPAPRPAPAPRRAAAPDATPGDRPAGDGAAAGASAGPPAGAGLDGDEAVAAVRAALEAANKMLLLAALDTAREIRLEGPQLVARFDASAASFRGTVERSRSALEKIAREATGRAVRLATFVDETAGAPAARGDAARGEATRARAGDGAEAPAPAAPPAEASAPADAPAPAAARAPARPAPAADPAASPAASDPVVQSLLDIFKGQLVGVEPPPDADA